MEIQIPDLFIIVPCGKCQTEHAPIRDCPESESYSDPDLWDENNPIHGVFG